MGRHLWYRVPTHFLTTETIWNMQSVNIAGIFTFYFFCKFSTVSCRSILFLGNKKKLRYGLPPMTHELKQGYDTLNTVECFFTNNFAIRRNKMRKYLLLFSYLIIYLQNQSISECETIFLCRYKRINATRFIWFYWEFIVKRMIVKTTIVF